MKRRPAASHASSSSLSPSPTKKSRPAGSKGGRQVSILIRKPWHASFENLGPDFRRRPRLDRNSYPAPVIQICGLLDLRVSYFERHPSCFQVGESIDLTGSGGTGDTAAAAQPLETTDKKVCCACTCFLQIWGPLPSPGAKGRHKVRSTSGTAEL